MMPLSLIIRDTRAGNQLKKERYKINRLLFMDDLKLYGNNSSQIDSLVEIVWSYLEGIGMKFGIDKCTVLELERGRLVRVQGIELPDGERMKDVDQEGYIAHKFSGKWIRNGFLKKETEGMLFAAQKQALRTNSIEDKQITSFS